MPSNWPQRLKKKPSTSEVLDWLRLLLAIVVAGGLIYLWLAALTPWVDHQQRLLWLPAPALYAGLTLTGLGILVCVSILFPREREARA